MGTTGIPDIEAKIKSKARIDFNAHKHGFAAMVDRGDPGAVDFDMTILIGDFAWRDLDLSPYVGARACWAVLGGTMLSVNAGEYIAFRTKGNVNFPNVGEVNIKAAWILQEINVGVFTSSAGKIQYSGVWPGLVVGFFSVRARSK